MSRATPRLRMFAGPKIPAMVGVIVNLDLFDCCLTEMAKV